MSQPAFALTFVTRRIFEESPERVNEYFHHYKIVNIKDTEKQMRAKLQTELEAAQKFIAELQRQSG